ncbi:NAD(P)H-binding protein [Streptacidiphilus sp. ASG 303]|uniref:SDR family oxidoreductase n=1 Tax=Streptacidiphilus sp. ASG 303 TaxID=2896847 RepID=UPI001E547484|nr:NAD(P)H-binding protein [Streptacidiphilus sp. ASG 303]MCD0486071.1 NAD(P)H-binding protein [Streptacidiphilus sp. ASG 303]
MRISVIGGTGFMGSRLVRRLVAEGHEAIAHDRSTGCDLLTGEGLPQAVASADVVVNAIDAPSFDAAAASFFRTTADNLLAAAERARVRHAVLLSIVGIDRVPQVDYYRAKLLQEERFKHSAVAWSIVRSTQFMEFVDKIMSWTTEGNTVRLPSTPLQPVAADEAVQFLAEVSVGTPLKSILNVAGPDVIPLDELGRLTLKARPEGDLRVVTDESAGLFAAVSGGAVTAPKGARLGSVHYVRWLTERTPHPA